MSLHQHCFAIAVHAFHITCGVYQDFGHKDVPTIWSIYWGCARREIKVYRLFLATQASITLLRCRLHNELAMPTLNRRCANIVYTLYHVLCQRYFLYFSKKWKSVPQSFSVQILFKPSRFRFFSVN